MALANWPARRSRVTQAKALACNRGAALGPPLGPVWQNAWWGVPRQALCSGLAMRLSPPGRRAGTAPPHAQLACLHLHCGRWNLVQPLPSRSPCPSSHPQRGSWSTGSICSSFASPTCVIHTPLLSAWGPVPEAPRAPAPAALAATPSGYQLGLNGHESCALGCAEALRPSFCFGGHRACKSGVLPA